MTTRASPRARLVMALPVLAAVLTAASSCASGSGEGSFFVATAGRPTTARLPSALPAVLSEVQPAAAVTRQRSFLALARDLTVGILVMATVLAFVSCVVLEACLTLWFDVHVARVHVEPSRKEAGPRGPPGRA
ncbi:MAG: hypothetical protein U0166_00380 [Acidobacteriota bacterium]